MEVVRLADDDLILEVGAEKSRPAGEEERDETAGDESASGAAARQTFSFSQAYKMRHREPMVRRHPRFLCRSHL
jgi:KUP system potassium uptake protein